MCMKQYLREHRGEFIGLFLCALTFFIVFGLYHLPLDAVLYPTFLCLGGILVCHFLQYRRQKAKRRELERLKNLPDDLLEALDRFEDGQDAAYREIVKALYDRENARRAGYEAQIADSMDYYSAWVHQIKTPIASMRLKLEQEDSVLSRTLSEELLRIEQYVGMVLTYQRLQSDSTDYVFREYSLEKNVKGVVRRFAGQFIGRGIRLELNVSADTIVTDDKWLTFVLEQIISNSIKYTREGAISIDTEEPSVLCIRDTGIGIAPEDLPRIFEKGYTGENGRVEKSASGLGLYLCREICGRLGIGITACSVPGEGTTIRLKLPREQFVFE